MANFKCCLGCTERHYKCHSTCERYKTEQEENEKKKEARRKDTQAYGAFREHQLRLYRKYERKK